MPTVFAESPSVPPAFAELVIEVPYRMHMKIKIIILGLLFIALPAFASASSSASFNASGEEFYPAVGAASSPSYFMSNVLVTTANGQQTSPSYLVVTGSPLVNSSISSAPASTTTIPVNSSGAVPPGFYGGGNPTSTSGGGHAATGNSSNGVVEAQYEVYNVRLISLTNTSATISFDTTSAGISSVSYSVAGAQQGNSTKPLPNAAFNHVHELSGLVPGTQYVFTLFVNFTDGQARLFTESSYVFTTGSAPEAVSPVTSKTVERMSDQPDVVTEQARVVSIRGNYYDWMLVVLLILCIGSLWGWFIVKRMKKAKT